VETINLIAGVQNMNDTETEIMNYAQHT
jgi:hypothetical protein